MHAFLLLAAGVAADPPAPRPLPAVLPAAATDPLLRSEPAVALDWTGPAVVRLGKPNAYTLTVKNTSRGFVQQVTVQVRPPDGATLGEPKPAARVVDGVHLWDVGTLEPGEAKPLTLTVTGGRRGDLQCQAWVTFTGTAGMTVKVQEPKVEARIEAPARVNVGGTFDVRFVGENAGDCPQAGMEVLVEARPLRPTVDGPDNYWTPKTPIAAGKSVTALGRYTADKPGTFTLRTSVRADDGLTASASRTVTVVGPVLTATVSGPDKLLVGRKWAYTVTVKNAGELAVEDAVAVVALPAGLRGSAPDGRHLFPLGALKPGEERTRTVEAIAAATGVQPVVASVSGSRGASATAECRTAVDGVPALRVELVDLADPVEKGQETTYEVRITNTGTKADEAVTLAVEVPPGLRYVSASGPTGSLKPVNHGISVTVPRVLRLEFDPVRELAPKTEAVFRIKVQATAAGDVRFKAVVTSKHLATPVIKEESTRVYGD